MKNLKVISLCFICTIFLNLCNLCNLYNLCLAQCNANFTTSDEIGCHPLEVTMTNTSMFCTDSVFWNFGDGVTSTDTAGTITHTYLNTSSSDTAYILMLIAHDSIGIADTVLENIVVHPSPVVNVTLNTKDCPPLQDTITSASTGADTWYWDFGDGTFDTTTTDASFIHIYNNSFPDSNVIYVFTLIVENIYGCTDTVTENITVYQKVTADFTALPGFTGCSPFTVNFSNSSSGGNSYQWNFGDGSPVSTSQNPSHTFTAVGTDTTYIVQLIVSSPKCTDTITKNIVVVDSLPVVDLGADITVCGSLLLDAGNPGAAYLWSTGETTQVITVTSSGQYDVEVSTSGCTPIYDTIIVTINPNPAVDLGDDTSICGGSLVLDAGFPGSTWLWQDNSTSQTFTVVSTGIYWVDVTDSLGCTARDSITVVINTGSPVVDLGADTAVCGGIILDAGNNPGAIFNWSTGDTTQTISVTGNGTYFVEVINGCDTVYDTVVISVFPVVVVNLGSDTIICNGDSIMLDAGNPGMIYNWSTIDSAQTITVNATGTYAVEVINPAAGCSGSDTITITVSDGPAAGFTITSLGFTVTFTNTSVDATSWYWDFGDGTGTSTLQDPVYTYATDGSYLVTLIVTNPCDSDTITQVIDIISGIRGITIPGDGIIIYPNPFSNAAILFFPQTAAEGYTFTLYNILGKEVKRIADIKTSELKITRDDLLRGFYFYKVESENRILKTGKIIIIP